MKLPSPFLKGDPGMTLPRRHVLLMALLAATAATACTVGGGSTVAKNHPWNEEQAQALYERIKRERGGAAIISRLVPGTETLRAIERTERDRENPSVVLEDLQVAVESREHIRPGVYFATGPDVEHLPLPNALLAPSPYQLIVVVARAAEGVVAYFALLPR